jgi:tellurite resistance protein
MVELAENPRRMEHFPISWFALVMGLAGVAIAWSRGEVILKLPVHVGSYLLYSAVLAFVVLLALYALKAVRHRPEVVKEFGHPIKLNFFPTISIGLILLSIGFLHDCPELSRYLWMTGAAIHLLFTFYVMSAWINHRQFEIQHINPAWFIPVVGNILVPIAGVHHASPEISWFFFAIGLVFWLVLMTIIFYRMIFHEPLPARLVPTLFILIAPPAVGFIAYMSLTESFDAFARVLYYAALFLTLMLLTQARRFYTVPFFLSWWAYSFPMAAITIATLVVYKNTGLAFFHGLSLALLALLSLIIAFLVVRTAIAVSRHEICVEEG